MIERGYEPSAGLRDARNRLLPAAGESEVDLHIPQPPPDCWKHWESPKTSGVVDREPIDLAVADLIRKRRLPRLRDRAELEALGIPCPYWYAREGVVMALQAAELAALEAADANQGRNGKRQDLDKLIALAPKAVTALKTIAGLQSALTAAVHLQPKALHHAAMWRDDDLQGRYERAWNAYCEHADPLARAIVQLREVAKAAHSGLTNTPPDYFDRAFAETMRITFDALTGATEPWGATFGNFLSAARASAGLPEKSGEKLLKIFRGMRKTQSE